MFGRKKEGIVKGAVQKILERKYGNIDNFIFFNSYEDAEKALQNAEIEFLFIIKKLLENQFKWILKI